MCHPLFAWGRNELIGSILRSALYVHLGVRQKIDRRWQIGPVRAAEWPIHAGNSGDSGVGRWGKLAQVAGVCGEVLTPTGGSYAVPVCLLFVYLLYFIYLLPLGRLLPLGYLFPLAYLFRCSFFTFLFRFRFFGRHNALPFVILVGAAFVEIEKTGFSPKKSEKPAPIYLPVMVTECVLQQLTL